MTKLSEENPSKGMLSPHNWVDEHGNYLYNYALGRLRNHEQAENAVQETFLAALSSLDNFAGRSSERTWLTGILKHKIIDHIRKCYKERPASGIQENEEAIDRFFDRNDHINYRPSGWKPDPEELLENDEFWKVFQKCHEKLPQLTAEAFTLKEIENLDSKKICEVLNISKSNFWVLMHRARLQLRQCLEINWFENTRRT